MSIRRVVLILVSWVLLLAVAHRLLGDLGLFLDPAVFAFVLLLPWVAALAAHGPGELLAALRDGFDARPGELAPDRRALSATVLHTLAGASVAVGVLGLFATVIANLNAIASSGGQTSAGQMAIALGSGLLAPVHGLALRTFLYEPLAAAVEGAETGLGAELA